MKPGTHGDRIVLCEHIGKLHTSEPRCDRDDADAVLASRPAVDFNSVDRGKILGQYLCKVALLLADCGRTVFKYKVHARKKPRNTRHILGSGLKTVGQNIRLDEGFGHTSRSALRQRV